MLGRVVGLLVVPLALRAQQTTPVPSTPVKISGYMQTRITYQKRVGMTATLNRARLVASGTIATGFSYRLQAEFRTGNAGRAASVSLTDAYIRYVHQALGVQVGQFKTPFTWEYITSIADIETLDRSTVVDSLAPKRDIGIAADYQAGSHLLLTAGVFNGEGVNVTANRDSTVLGVARAAFRPVPQILIGANAARWFGDSTRYGGDVSYQDTRLVARGEYLVQTRDSLGGASDHGWYGLVGFKVVPKVQLVGKYEEFEREAVSAQQKNRAWSAGLNWFIVPPAVRLGAFYVSRKIGDPGTRVGVLQTQLQVRF
jgi:phosphate-selective porin